MRWDGPEANIEKPLNIPNRWIGTASASRPRPLARCLQYMHHILQAALNGATRPAQMANRCTCGGSLQPQARNSALATRRVNLELEPQ